MTMVLNPSETEGIDFPHIVQYKVLKFLKLSIIWSTPLDMNVYVKDELHSSRIDSLIL